MLNLTYSELASILQEHNLLIIVAILSLAFTIGLKTTKVFLFQLCLMLILVGSYSIDGRTAGIIAFLVAIVQFVFFLFLLFKVKSAIDYEYTLVIEKTHEIPRKITRNGNLGTRRTFF